MATLTQRIEIVEERADTLESILAAFMARTDASMARTDASMARTDEAIGRLERIIERREREGAREREEAARERKEMKEQAAREREEAARVREEMKEQAAREREEAARVREEMKEQAAREREEAARVREEMKEQAARERKEMNQRWGELANKMGTIVEDIVAPSIRRLAREVFDCGDLRAFYTRTVRTRSDDPSREREFDALYVGTQAVLLNETKASARPEYARAFVQFLESGQFAQYVPEYPRLPIVPVFSSLSIPADVVTYLTRRGIYAVAMGDEAMQVLNLDEVRRRSPAR